MQRRLGPRIGLPDRRVAAPRSTLSSVAAAALEPLEPHVVGPGRPARRRRAAPLTTKREDALPAVDDLGRPAARDERRHRVAAGREHVLEGDRELDRLAGGEAPGAARSRAAEFATNTFWRSRVDERRPLNDRVLERRARSARARARCSGGPAAAPPGASPCSSSIHASRIRAAPSPARARARRRSPAPRRSPSKFSSQVAVGDLARARRSRRPRRARAASRGRRSAAPRPCRG